MCTDPFDAIILVRFSKARLTPMDEYWLVQGFPHPDCSEFNEALREKLPFTALVTRQPIDADASHRRIDIKDQRCLVGNSMHWAQIGAWFIYNMSISRKGLLLERQLA